MKKTLVVTRTAKRDLYNIWRYIAQSDHQAAQTFLKGLTAKIEWIAEIDFTGAPRDHIREGLRAFPYRRRCIYFRSYPDHIVIIRVIHSAQDIAKLKFDE